MTKGLPLEIACVTLVCESTEAACTRTWHGSTGRQNHLFVERLRENARAVRVQGFSRGDPVGFLERGEEVPR